MKVRNFVKSAGAAVAVSAIGLGNAFAVADTTAIDGAKTDIGVYGAAVIGVCVAIAVIAWTRRVVH